MSEYCKKKLCLQLIKAFSQGKSFDAHGVMPPLQLCTESFLQNFEKEQHVHQIIFPLKKTLLLAKCKQSFFFINRITKYKPCAPQKN